MIQHQGSLEVRAAFLCVVVAADGAHHRRNAAGKHRDGQVNLAAHQVSEHGCRAFVGHMQELGPGLLAEFFGRQVEQAAGAGLRALDSDRGADRTLRDDQCGCSIINC